MIHDLKFALRQLAKAPGFTATVVLTLALGIGACTAIYSALDSIVLHPYDDRETERNVFLKSVKLPQRVAGGLSVPDFLDLEKQATSFELMAQWRVEIVHVTGAGVPLRLRGLLVTPRYFEVFGAKLALGRAFVPEEFISGKDNVVVLGYACWQRAFGGAADVIGRTLLIDDKPCTVIGVISERFERTGIFTDTWRPHVTDRLADANASDPRGGRSSSFFTMARLRHGITIERAQAELDTLAAALAQEYPETNSNYGILADPRGAPSEYIVAPVIQLLFGAVACLMLIVCANVASLLLVRANVRQREMSVRAALGASRGRLIRQLLTENILVALVGGAAGVLLAAWALDFIRSSIPGGALNLAATGLARLTSLELDGGAVAFAVGLSIATALVFGVAPAWVSSSADLNEALKQGTRGGSEGRPRGRFRATLVIFEIAMAVTLLACSGLLIRSFIRMTAYDPGFDPKHTAFVRLTLKGANYDGRPDQRIAFEKTLINRIQSAPEVETVGITSHFPLSGNRLGSMAGFEIEGGATMAVTERSLACYYSVSPDYFRTLGIPLKQGRFFAENDDANGRRVVIINQTLARQHFPNQNAIGKRMRFAIANQPDAWREIIGVVGDVGQVNVGEVQPAQFYESHTQRPNLDMFTVVVVRGHGNPALLPAIVNTQVQALDSNLPLGTDMSTAEDFIRTKLTRQRLMLQLLVAFAFVALFIASIGIYGVIAFSVSQRTVEIGIRMALGAQKQDVLRMVLKHGAGLVGIGFAIGTGATFVAGRAIESQLYNTSGHDPASLIGITAFFALIAALACWLPARRATKVDPIVALRAE